MLKDFRRADKYLLSLIALLLFFGLIMIYNATSIYSQGSLGDAYRLVLLQVGWIVLGLVGFFIFLKIDYNRVRKIAFPIFLFALIFLALLAIANIFTNCEGNGIIFMPCINGAYRWFYFNPPPMPELPVVGVLGFQPSEFAKFALVFYLAVILEKSVREKKDSFFVFTIVAGLIALLVVLQPNLSTALLLVSIASVMYFVSGASLIQFFISLPIISTLSLLLMFASEYRRQRILTYLNPSETGDLTLGYHIKQIQIALGSGGFWGLGFGQSRQKFHYLPEVAADSIFAVIGEELGFIGAFIFIIVFTLLIQRGYVIAKNSRDLLGKLLATGVTTWIAVQFFINIAAMVRIIPLTGVPLPLVSYGGSSMIFSLMGLGLLANVSKKTSG